MRTGRMPGALGPALRGVRARAFYAALGLSVGSGTVALSGVCPGGCVGGCASCASSLSLLAVPLVAAGLQAARRKAAAGRVTVESA